MLQEPANENSELAPATLQAAFRLKAENALRRLPEYEQLCGRQATFAHRRYAVFPSLFSVQHWCTALQISPH